MGGEKRLPRQWTLYPQGSPPRGRGKVLFLSVLCVTSGITPAWAGKSAGFQSAPSGPRDHPRVGGEKSSPRIAAGRPLGSPPRGRGKGFFHGRSVPLAGITPAWAGKSFSMTARGRVRRDHPRVGGEKINRLLSILICWGSPPRGRGKEIPKRKKSETARITPAWAGKSRECGLYH